MVWVYTEDCPETRSYLPKIRSYLPNGQRLEGKLDLIEGKLDQGQGTIKGVPIQSQSGNIRMTFYQELE